MEACKPSPEQTRQTSFKGFFFFFFSLPPVPLYPIMPRISQPKLSPGWEYRAEIAAIYEQVSILSC